MDKLLSTWFCKHIFRMNKGNHATQAITSIVANLLERTYPG